MRGFASCNCLNLLTGKFCIDIEDIGLRACRSAKHYYIWQYKGFTSLVRLPEGLPLDYLLLGV